MGILKGKYFYAQEIEPVIRLAVQELSAQRLSALSYEQSALAESQQSAAHLALAMLLREATQKADDVANGKAEAVLIRAGDPWWKRIDDALSLVNSAKLRAAVAALPNDPQRGPSWLDNKLLVFGGLGAALFIGYQLTKK